MRRDDLLAIMAAVIYAGWGVHGADAQDNAIETSIAILRKVERKAFGLPQTRETNEHHP